jgi:hypothetical protein
MASNHQDTLLKCLKLILRPVARFCLRHNLGLKDIIEMSKVMLIEVAVAEMEEKEQRINMSRLSSITGVHRKDCVRIHREGNVSTDTNRFASRVIGVWRDSKRYQTPGGRPRVITYKGEDSELAEIVSSLSTDLRSGAVLFDLERLGAVQRTSTGLKLCLGAYVPKGNPTEGFRLLAEDSTDLMDAIVDNILCEEQELPNYHAKSEYDNISPEDVPRIRRWLFKQCSAFQTRVEKYISKYDLDINPNRNKEGGERIVLGMFSKTPIDKVDS